MATTPEECLDALWEAAERLGESPTKAAYEELGLQPASATIIRQIGGWNAAKEQAGLETVQPKGGRLLPKPDDVTLPEGTSWEELSVDQRWHYRNREENANRTQERRARLRDWVDERKSDRGCNQCDESDAACLDLHHPDPESKDRAVGELITYGYGKDRLRKELDQCEVLCANCHRAHHHDVSTTGLRGWVHAHKATRGCIRCGMDDPVALDCHHTGEKRESVARLLVNDRPWEEVRDEVERCIVLCANCHRRKHDDVSTHDGKRGNPQH